MSSLTITNPQAAQAPQTSFTLSTTAVTTPQLAAGASIAPAGGVFYTASADEILITCSKYGTLTGDCYLELQVTVTSGVVEVLKTWTNAQIAANFAEVIKVGLGTQFRFQLRVGTMTGANGVQLRFRN